MSLRRNILWLQALQFSGMLIPLVTQPWLARALGPVNYGRYSFVLAVVAYLTLFSDFGFAWTATRAVASCRGDTVSCSRIVSATYGAKVCLLLIGVFCVFALTLVNASLKAESYLLLIGCVGVMGTVLAPAWYFQGIEQPRVTSLIDIITRAGCAPLLLIFVRSPTDLTKAVLLSSVSQFLVGLFGVIVLTTRAKLVFILPNLAEIFRRIREGFTLFLSTSAVSLYTTANGIILGLIARSEQVAYFAAAQKIAVTASSVFVPINQAIYPRIVKKFTNEVQEGMSIAKTALLIEGTIGLVVTLSLLLMSRWIVSLLFGTAYYPAVAALRWMAVLPVLLGFASVFANLIIIPLRHDSKHVWMVTGAALTNLLLIVPCVTRWGATGAAMAVTAAELFVFLYSGVHAIKLMSKWKSLGSGG